MLSFRISGVVFSIVALTASSCCSASSQTCQHRSISNAVLRAGHVTQNISSSSRIRCAIRACGCHSRCVASFNAATGQCWSGAFGDGLLRLTGDAILSRDASGSWKTLSRSDVAWVEQPSALWLLDEETKTENLGKLGSQLQATIANIAWVREGPRGNTKPTSFANYTLASQFSVPLRFDNGSHIMLLSKKGLTWTVWVKAEASHTCPIFEFRTIGSQATHLWFFPSLNVDQVIFNLRPPGNSPSVILNHFITGVNVTNRHEWRHIAAVYDDVNGGRVFLDGNVWQISETHVNTTEIGVTDIFHLGYCLSEPWRNFEGSLACAAVFERVLSQEEVRSVMNSCP